MADVAKVITIIGSSPESFAKAADAAVQEASKTLRGITGADVVYPPQLLEDAYLPDVTAIAAALRDSMAD